MNKALRMTLVILMFAGSACQASEPLSPGGQVNWCASEPVTIEVIGAGDVPTYVTGILQSQKIARDAAVRNAYNMLTKTINELQIDSERTVFSLTVDNQAAREKIAGLVKQAKLVRWSEDLNRTYLGFRVNMFGVDGVAKIALEALKSLDSVVNPHSVPTTKKVSGDMALEDVYSGIIVDARDVGFRLSLLPKIYDVGGRLVYTYQDVNRNCIVSKGLVEYKKKYGPLSVKERISSSAGVKPMMVKALKAADNRCNIIISTEDADKIMEQNAKWGVLKTCSVVIVLQEQQCE